MTRLLFVHGILGKPDYFDFLLPYVPEGVSTTAILMEGHGKGPKEFAGASMSAWRAQVAKAVDEFKAAGNKLVIVAHSMGCLFAIDAAVRGKADALFLLNPPLSIRLTPRLFSSAYKVWRGKINDPWASAAKDAYSISDDPNPLHYLGWIPRYLELFREIRRTRGIVRNLNVPTEIWLSALDEMVSPHSALSFPDTPLISVTLLPQSGHYRYPTPDCDTLVRSFSAFLKKIAP